MGETVLIHRDIKWKADRVPVFLLSPLIQPYSIIRVPLPQTVYLSYLIDTSLLPGPQLAVVVALGVATMILDTLTMTCIQHDAIVWNNFTALIVLFPTLSHLSTCHHPWKP